MRARAKAQEISLTATTTNLLAAVVVTLVTNVVPSDNAKWERDPIMVWPEGGGPMRMVKEPTEQYVTTNVTEHVEVTITMPDGPHVLGYDRLLSSVTAILKKQESWSAAGIRTNAVAVESNGKWMMIDTVTTNIAVFGP